MTSPHCLIAGQPISLAETSTRADDFHNDRDKAEKQFQKLREEFIRQQARLYAEGKQKLLIVLQAMDAGGKDGTIRHSLKGVNPQGVQVTSFKKPTTEELDHDFLWRIHSHAPAKGMIQIFNRSHYEDVLVPRVKNWIDMDEVKRRFNHINAWEQLLIDSGTQVLKFYLHISEEEQSKTFAERLEDPEKRWKYKSSDLAEAKLWPEYRIAFADIFDNCSKAEPWQIIPADDKWYRDYLISTAVVERLESLNMRYPQEIV